MNRDEALELAREVDSGKARSYVSAAIALSKWLLADEARQLAARQLQVGRGECTEKAGERRCAVPGCPVHDAPVVHRPSEARVPHEFGDTGFCRWCGQILGQVDGLPFCERHQRTTEAVIPASKRCDTCFEPLHGATIYINDWHFCSDNCAKQKDTSSPPRTRPHRCPDYPLPNETDVASLARYAREIADVPGLAQDVLTQRAHQYLIAAYRRGCESAARSETVRSGVSCPDGTDAGEPSDRGFVCEHQNEADRLRIMFLECWVCNAALQEPTEPPHCTDCSIGEEPYHAWEEWLSNTKAAETGSGDHDG